MGNKRRKKHQIIGYRQVNLATVSILRRIALSSTKENTSFFCLYDHVFEKGVGRFRQKKPCPLAGNPKLVVGDVHFWKSLERGLCAVDHLGFTLRFSFRRFATQNKRNIIPFFFMALQFTFQKLTPFPQPRRAHFNQPPTYSPARFSFGQHGHM